MVDISDPKWSEQDVANNGAAPDGVQGAYSPLTVAPVIRSIRGAVKRAFNKINAIYTTTGTATALVLTFSVAPAALVKGERYAFFASQTNTGAMTLNVNGLGAKAILQQDGAALAAGQIVSGSAIAVIYDGTAFRLENYVSNPKFTGTLSVDTVAATTITGTHTGNGAALTALNASNIATGTIADARLPATMAGKSFTTDVVMGQTLYVGQTNGGGIEVGRTDGVASGAFIDFHTSATVVDYNVRLLADGNTANGAGSLNIISGTLNHNGQEVWDKGMLPSPAVQATQVIAGNGLTGGGTIAANRTLTLGTPLPVTRTSTDAVGSTNHSHSLVLTAADLNAIYGYVPSKGDGLPIGSMIMIYGNDSSAPPGFLLANGAVVTTTYPELRAFGLARGWAVTSGNPRLPDMGGYFPRGWRTGQTVDSGRAFGSVQQDAMQAHRHQRNPNSRLEGTLEYNGSGNGGFYSGWNKSAFEQQTTGDVADARTADETRPSNVTVTYWVKAYDVDNTSGSINLSNVANDLSAVSATVSTLGARRQNAVTPSGNAYVFSGIPTGVQRVAVKFSGVTINNANTVPIIRVGNASSILSTGYITSSAGSNGAGTVYTTTDIPLWAGADTRPIYGVVEFKRLAPNTNRWIAVGTIGRSVNFLGTLTSDITVDLAQIQITTSAGNVPLGGANSLAIEWEF